jgi:hypothetical protein
MPDKNSELRCLALISATTSASRAHSVARLPARIAASAKDVPQAPPPTTPKWAKPFMR